MYAGDDHVVARYFTCQKTATFMRIGYTRSALDGLSKEWVYLDNHLILNAANDAAILDIDDNNAVTYTGRTSHHIGASPIWLNIRNLASID